MTFNTSNLEIVLSTIEENLEFQGDNIKEPQSWNLKLGLPVQKIIDKSPSEIEKLRYTIKALELFGYIQFSNSDYSIIDQITTKGLKLIFSYNHNIKFD